MAETGWKIRTAVAALLIPPAIHVVSLAVLIERLARWSARPVGGTPPAPDSTAWRVDRLLRAMPWPWHHTCLKRASTLFFLLRRSGYPVVLQVGVRKEPGGKLEAHAWLLLNGETFVEPAATFSASFSPIATFGS